METVMELQQIWLASLRKEGEMKRKEMVDRLRTLREEFEKDGVDILYMPMPVALVFSDVCSALGLDQEREEILGREAAEVIDRWTDSRIWVLTKKDNGSQILQRVDHQAPVAEALLSYFTKKRQAQRDIEDLFGPEEET